MFRERSAVWRKGVWGCADLLASVGRNSLGSTAGVNQAAIWKDGAGEALLPCPPWTGVLEHGEAEGGQCAWEEVVGPLLAPPETTLSHTASPWLSGMDGWVYGMMDEWINGWMHGRWIN